MQRTDSPALDTRPVAVERNGGKDERRFGEQAVAQAASPSSRPDPWHDSPPGSAASVKPDLSGLRQDVDDMEERRYTYTKPAIAGPEGDGRASGITPDKLDTPANPQSAPPAIDFSKFAPDFEKLQNESYTYNGPNVPRTVEQGCTLFQRPDGSVFLSNFGGLDRGERNASSFFRPDPVLHDPKEAGAVQKCVIHTHPSDKPGEPGQALSPEDLAYLAGDPKLSCIVALSEGGGTMAVRTDQSPKTLDDPTYKEVMKLGNEYQRLRQKLGHETQAEATYAEMVRLSETLGLQPYATKDGLTFVKIDFPKK